MVLLENIALLRGYVNRPVRIKRAQLVEICALVERQRVHELSCLPVLVRWKVLVRVDSRAEVWTPRHVLVEVVLVLSDNWYKDELYGQRDRFSLFLTHLERWYTIRHIRLQLLRRTEEQLNQRILNEQYAFQFQATRLGSAFCLK